MVDWDSDEPLPEEDEFVLGYQQIQYNRGDGAAWRNGYLLGEQCAGGTPVCVVLDAAYHRQHIVAKEDTKDGWDLG
jgi:hypothetical protein